MSISLSSSVHTVVLEIQEALSLPACDWSQGARSGWTGSSVVGVHCRVSEGCVIRIILLGVCLCVFWGGGVLHAVDTWL